MRNKRVISLITLITLLFIFIWISQSVALKEDTHKAINEKVAKGIVNSFSLNDYLINNLGFKKGYEEILNGVTAEGINVKKQIFQWLGYGGEQEDRPGSNTDYITGKPSRSVNHFHNPLKSWDEAGLNDTFLGKSYTGQSSVLWAQNPNQNIGGKWSWQDARDYYYTALTSTNKDDREKAFAKTFRAVGQQMHLVEDASVPAHVRNDIHIPNPLYPHYEQKIEAFRTKQNIYGTFWNDLLANPITFDKAILDIPSTHPSAPVPISRIIDTDLYNGGNPNVTTTIYNSPQPIGIAEYTNANFLSKDTLFTHLYFNYPNISDTVLWIDNNNREYIKKVGKGDTINHLAISSWLYPFRIMYFPQYTDYLPVGLDEECYKEYAQKLIPRAVGYSAGLLNYFFRGDIDLVDDATTGSGYVIVNNTEEDMNGTFELYYDDASDNRQRLWIYTFTLGTKTSGNNKSTNITFTPPTDAKEPGKYMLVFRGKIGNEEDAVVGKEIMPLVFLIYQDAQNNPVYAVWSIENSGKKLVSYDFDISKYTTYFNIYNYRNSSVVKSDDNYQNHVYTIENLRIDNEYFQPGYNNGYPQYGRRLQSTNLLPTDKMIAIGVRNCFINGIFDYDTSYLNYPLGDASNYICSGRHSAYMDEKKKWIKNLSLWKINTNSGQIKYETENGWENGSVISYQKQSDIYAVLSPDKYIGLQSIGNGINYDIFWIEWNLQGYWWQKCRFFLDEVSNFYEVIQVNGLEGYHNIAINPAIGAFKKFVFGDTILEDKLSERVVEGEHESYRQLSKSVNVMDYDNVNIDETFICIYFTSSGRNYWYVRTWDGYYPECNTSGTVIYYGHDNWHSLTLKEYVLSYKIKDKELVKITTGYFTSGIYVTPGPFYNTSRNEGQRLSGVSTQATDKYLLYTYMLWTYSGPSNEDHFNDLDDTYWTFNKRILGIIDIETGTRTDHEVNDELLGQYKDTFDKTLPSAIGFHNGSVKKEE